MVVGNQNEIYKQSLDNLIGTKTQRYNAALPDYKEIANSFNLVGQMGPEGKPLDDKYNFTVDKILNLHSAGGFI